MTTPTDTAGLVEHEGFAPCPTCRQYSHSLGGDALTDAFNHFQSMFSHRGDGIPTQHNFDQKTRDAAQALMAAARLTAPPLEGDELSGRLGERARELLAAECDPDLAKRFLDGRRTFRSVDIASALRAIEVALASRASDTARIQEAVRVISRLEAACEALCAQRTHEQYLAMIELGQQPALLELDAARLSARAAATFLLSVRSNTT